MTDDTYANIFDLLRERARGDQGDEPAIHWRERTLNWKTVERAAREVAGGLRQLDIEPGDRVAVMLPNVPPYLFLQYAVHLIGAILVPIHELTPAHELGHMLEDCEAKALFFWGDYAETVEKAAPQTESLKHRIQVGSSASEVSDIVDWMETAPPYEDDPVGGGDDVALIRYTAGVTGKAKGAMLSHNGVLYAARETHYRLHILARDSVFGLMPLYHPFGSTLQLQMLLPSGAALRLQTQFNEEHALETIRQGEASVVVGLPMHFAALVDAAGEEENIGQLRFAVCGGGPLDTSVLMRFERIFGIRVATVYGTCEMSPTIAVNPAHREEGPRDALGRVIPGTEVRIVDDTNAEVPIGEVGEIVTRGPGLFRGYWNKPGATGLAIDAEGWFHTEDLGQMDINGWIYGVGRLEDRINKGGFSVYPREVESVINAHPSVHSCAVIGIPDRNLGEEIMALVVPRSGMPVDAEELMSYCSEQLAKYKAPRRVSVVDSLPRSPNGAVRRRELRERYAKKRA